MRIIEYAKKHKKKTTTILTVFFAVLFCGYLAAHLLSGFSEKLNTTPAALAKEDVYELYDAYIFRDEEILVSDYSGYRLDLVEDGALVGIGTEYARVYEDSFDEATVFELESIEESLSLLRSCNVSLAPSAVSEYRQKGLEIYKNILDTLSKGETKLASSHRERLIEIYSTLAIYEGDDEKVEENLRELELEIESLEERREEIIKSFGKNYQSFVATKTGYYYSGCDGYEEQMSSRNIGGKKLAELLFAIDGLDAEATPSGIGRLVYDPNWYAAVVVDMKDAVKYIAEDGEAKTGMYTVGFFDGGWNDMEMRLEKVTRASDDTRAVLLFSSADMNSGFNGARQRDMRIYVKSYSGYRVPTEAIRTALSDGEEINGVYVLTGGTVVWKKIEIVYSSPDGAFAIVTAVPEDQEDAADWLALNDSVIIGGKNLYDGKTVY